VYKLQEQFPGASISVSPTATGVILKGYVDNPDNVSRIVKVAEEYYPKVINNMTVGGAQQVQLHVKVMEVNRTKLRDLGVDFSEITSGGSFISSSVSGLLNSNSSIPLTPNLDANTLKFGILSGGNQFFGLLAAMEQNQLVKVLAEPTITAINGRPANFLAGGKVPYPIPASIGQPPAIQFQKYGTQIDFVPIVLGHGMIRLEVRPTVSELDYANAITISGTTVPALRERTVDTGVELRVGQTLALAGLIQSRVATSKSALPWLGDLPYLGVPFRRMTDTINEVELLILVRPELVEGLECNEVPPGGPGASSHDPNDWQLYMRGYVEVPERSPGGFGPAGPVEEVHPQPLKPGDNKELPPSAADTRRPGPPTLVSPDNSPNRSSMQKRQNPSSSNSASAAPGLIGPVGYDVKN
jgi:pilus assembly protein CpaC